jgi:N-acetyl-anhydromuramyl-L-alanine amidase AmpD
MSDCPFAQWTPAHASNFRAGPRHGYALIVVHCTDGHENAAPVADMWQKPHHGSSAHFVVGQGGEIVQAVRLADIAWHAHQANTLSVGIEHCARTPGELGPNDKGLRPSQAQLEASARLVAWLCRRADLEPKRGVILGHAEADPSTTHTRCPDGCGWPWETYLELVQREFDAYRTAS